MTFIIPFISIFPDVDMKNSKSRKILGLFLSSIFLFLYLLIFTKTWYYGIAFSILLYFLIKLLPTKHRGITHTFPFSFIFSFAISLFFSFVLGLDFSSFFPFFLSVFSAYALHLLLDKF